MLLWSPFWPQGPAARARLLFSFELFCQQHQSHLLEMSKLFLPSQFTFFNAKNLPCWIQYFVLTPRFISSSTAKKLLKRDSYGALCNIYGNRRIGLRWESLTGFFLPTTCVQKDSSALSSMAENQFVQIQYGRVQTGSFNDQTIMITCSWDQFSAVVLSYFLSCHVTMMTTTLPSVSLPSIFLTQWLTTSALSSSLLVNYFGSDQKSPPCLSPLLPTEVHVVVEGTQLRHPPLWYSPVAADPWLCSSV